MKKVFYFILIAIITSSLFLASCSDTIVRNIYQCSYDNHTTAITDVNYQMQYYMLDEIPLYQWESNYFIGDTVLVIQRMLHKPVDKKNSYAFTFSEYLYSADSTYNFVIRFVGKEKELIKVLKP